MTQCRERENTGLDPSCIIVLGFCVYTSVCRYLCTCVLFLLICHIPILFRMSLCLLSIWFNMYYVWPHFLYFLVATRYVNWFILWRTLKWATLFSLNFPSLGWLFLTKTCSQFIYSTWRYLIVIVLLRFPLTPLYNIWNLSSYPLKFPQLVHPKWLFPLYYTSTAYQMVHLPCGYTWYRMESFLLCGVLLSYK